MIEINAMIILSFLAVCISAVSLLRNSKNHDTAEVAQRAAENATLNTKLDNIGSDVRDIKYDVTAVKKDISRLDKELAVVRSSVRSAHHRLDDAGIGKGDYEEPVNKD